MSLFILNHVLMGASKFGLPEGSLYTYEQVDELIRVQGYVPVANGAELNVIRATSNITTKMGKGTPWYKIYTFNIGSKFLQVDNISLAAYANFARIVQTAGTGFIYDGNELKIIDLTINTSSSSLGLISSNLNGCTLKNVRLYGNVNQTNANGTGCGILAGGNAGTITNCKVYGNITSEGVRVGGIVGENSGTMTGCEYSGDAEGKYAAAFTFVGGIVGVNTGTVTSCIVSGNVKAHRKSGGIVGWNNGGNVLKCLTSATITATQSYCGGACGDNAGTIRETRSTGNNTSGALTYKGGFCAYNTGTIENCYANGNSLNGTIVAGFSAFNSGTITNCYSTGSATGTNNSGFVAQVSGGTVANSYWDTTTSGNATSAAGTEKTTAQLKETGIGEAGIYSTWDDEIWTKEVDGLPELIALQEEE
jgi:hypothetical protein